MNLLRISSDLHTEFWPKDEEGFFSVLEQALPHDERDKKSTLILAGDIFVVPKIETVYPIFERLGARFKEVFFILGNHEHWGFDYYLTAPFIRGYFLMKKAPENVTLLENNYCRLDHNTSIYGATMWTDFNRGDGRAIRIAQQAMPDFRQRNLSPSAVLDNNIETRAQIRLLKPEIIVTHHLPFEESISKKFTGSPLNPAFANTGIREPEETKLWIHGHTHDSCDYTRESGIRVVCNPFGYFKKETNLNYNPRLFIEVE